MNNRCANKQIFNATFRDHAEKVGIILAGTKTYGANFDPDRNTGYIKTKKNPIWVKALIQTLSANSLVHKNLGLKEIGAVRLTIQDCDVALFKMAERITIDGEYYTVYNQALGNRVQIFPIKFGFSKIIIFRDTKHG